MSLDVYLNTPGEMHTRNASSIFVRANGRTVEIPREEWDKSAPGIEPLAALVGGESESVFHANITHNLGTMAAAAGIYKHLWRPEEIDITKAAQLIEPLKAGLSLLKSDPERFKKFNPSNGWGDYEGLVSFVSEYAAACEANPNAIIEISR